MTINSSSIFQIQTYPPSQNAMDLQMPQTGY